MTKTTAHITESILDYLTMLCQPITLFTGLVRMVESLMVEEIFWCRNFVERDHLKDQGA
jgi:hypothetical protein